MNKLQDKKLIHLGNQLALAPIFWVDKVFINSILANREDKIALRDAINNGMTARLTRTTCQDGVVVFVDTEEAA